LWESSSDKVIAFTRGGLVFAFNFHPMQSHVDYRFPAPPGKYAMVLDSDAEIYAGRGRLDPGRHHFTMPGEPGAAAHLLRLYLPTRTAVVLEPLEN
jgi:1,4-alpha-glucan branching enzyme